MTSSALRSYGQKLGLGSQFATTTRSGRRPGRSNPHALHDKDIPLQRLFIHQISQVCRILDDGLEGRVATGPSPRIIHTTVIGELDAQTASELR